MTAARTEEFWALRDIDIEIHQGEVVGIVGGNGAGKSTLLKILSRIVAPTRGRVELRGRVGSLLEVGTGFHPELTGRENIFLNGSILGMKRREIAKAFDQIVDFSGIEKFLDTPVKRYSSGMYVRLAFAVAAHLETEILIIDEVLAVGDIAFQKKCLGKMSDVAKGGRTVLFVSHNMGTIRTLCSRAVILDAGQLTGSGSADQQVMQYLQLLEARAATSLQERTDRRGSGAARITSIDFVSEDNEPLRQAMCGDPIGVRVTYRSQLVGVRPFVAISMVSADGQRLFHVDNKERGVSLPAVRSAGTYTCQFPKLPLPTGTYHVDVLLALNAETADHVCSAAVLDVISGDYFGIGRAFSSNGGLFCVDHNWE